MTVCDFVSCRLDRHLYDYNDDDADHYSEGDDASDDPTGESVCKDLKHNLRLPSPSFAGDDTPSTLSMQSTPITAGYVRCVPQTRFSLLACSPALPRSTLRSPARDWARGWAWEWAFQDGASGRRRGAHRSFEDDWEFCAVPPEVVGVDAGTVRYPRCGASAPVSRSFTRAYVGGYVRGGHNGGYGS